MKKLMVKVGAVIISSALMYGCSTTNSIPYKASIANVVSLQQVLKAGGIKISVGNIHTASGIEENLMCRLMGPVKVAPGKSLSQYIKEAFEEELFLAQVYSPNAPVAIDGRIEELSFSSISPANWKISMNVKSNKHPGYTVSVNYGFNTSFDAWSACKNVADAFGPAVQELLKRVVTHPQFKLLAS